MDLVNEESRTRTGKQKKRPSVRRTLLIHDRPTTAVRRGPGPTSQTLGPRGGRGGKGRGLPGDRIARARKKEKGWPICSAFKLRLLRQARQVCGKSGRLRQRHLLSHPLNLLSYFLFFPVQFRPTFLLRFSDDSLTIRHTLGFSIVVDTQLFPFAYSCLG